MDKNNTVPELPDTDTTSARGQPSIPLRTSSKRQAESNLDGYRKRQKGLQDDIKKSRERLKPAGSFNAEYWNGRVNLNRQVRSEHDLRKKISILEFKRDGRGEEADWIKSEEGQEICIEDKAMQTVEKKCAYQYERIASGEGATSTIGRAFLQLLMTSKRGMNIDTGGGKRKSSDQKRLRDALEAVTESSDRGRFIKCPITNQWHDTSDVRAAHIFPYKTGQEIMTLIFGAEADKELFSIANGILMHTRAEILFDKGLLIIVPDLPDDAGLAQYQLWHSLDVKEYKISIPDKNHADVKFAIKKEEPNKTWASLDGRRVDFFGKWRPRARYLYYHYMTSILRQSWRPDLGGEGKWADKFQSELGRAYWGTLGKYMRREQIGSMVTEIGHTYEGLMEAYDVQQNTNPGEEGDLALVAASAHIADGEDSEDSDEEEDGEEEEESR